MIELKITVFNEEDKDTILEVLTLAEENDEIKEAFNVEVNEI